MKKMRSLLLLSLGAGLWFFMSKKTTNAPNAKDKAEEISVELSQNPSGKLGGNVIIDKICTVKEGDTLTLDGGTVLNFKDGGKLIVEGVICVNDSSDEGVTVTTQIESTPSHEPLLFFKSDTSLSSWKFKDIQYQDAAFLTFNREISFEKCLFSNISNLSSKVGYFITTNADSQDGKNTKLRISDSSFTKLSSKSSSLLVYLAPFKGSLQVEMTGNTFVDCSNLMLGRFNNCNNGTEEEGVTFFPNASLKFVRNSLKGNSLSLLAKIKEVTFTDNDILLESNAESNGKMINVLSCTADKADISNNRIRISKTSSRITPLVLDCRKTLISKNEIVLTDVDADIYTVNAEIKNTLLCGGNLICLGNTSFESCDISTESLLTSKGSGYPGLLIGEESDYEEVDLEEIPSATLLSFESCVIHGAKLRIKADQIKMNKCVFPSVEGLSVLPNRGMGMLETDMCYFPKLKAVDIKDLEYKNARCDAPESFDLGFEVLSDDDRSNRAREEMKEITNTVNQRIPQANQ